MINGLAEKRILILIKKEETKTYFVANLMKHLGYMHHGMG
jgi:hypothetical protein